MTGKIPGVNVAKSSSESDGFDKGCRWNILGLTIVVEESSCEDCTLLDSPSAQYAGSNDNMSVNNSNKVIKMNYSRKFNCAKFIGEVF